MSKKIQVRGARQHNLKDIDLDIPKNQLVVFTGISGSGKTSLAFDTIYAEGQRRYVESLSSYARQFLGVMDKPDVDQIDGLSPSISIGQKTIPHNPRSTVGTVTEIYDYLRLLYSKIGHPHCPQCSREIKTQTPQQIVDQIIDQVKEEKKDSQTKKRGVRLMILAPLVKDRKGEYSSLLDDLQRRGFTHVRIDNQVRRLDEDFVLIRTNRHTIEAVVDRLVITDVDDDTRVRLAESVEKALKLSSGTVVLSVIKDASFNLPERPKEMADHLFSELFSCPVCNISLPQMEPRSFSFNSPNGACTECDGLGSRLEVDPERIFNPSLTINEGGIFPWSSIGNKKTWTANLLAAVADKLNFSLDVPIKELSEETKSIILFGADDQVFDVETFTRTGEKKTYPSKFKGVIADLNRRYRETPSQKVRRRLERFMRETACPECQGTRLKPSVLGVTIGEHNIAQVTAMYISDLREWLEDNFKGNKLVEQEKEIAEPIYKELQNRLEFLSNVGLGYLTLDRTAHTLSAGEAQRIRLASQIGSGLSGILYVLDEPSIGLHYRDHDRLLNTLTGLRNLDNTVIVVEHDPQTIKRSDWVIDFGPKAGDKGGEIVFQGTPEELINAKTLTSQYISGRRQITLHEKTSGKGSKREEAGKERYLRLLGCREHNLKGIDIEFPLNNFICVTGVSGSGKSTLIMDTLYKRLALEFYQTQEVPGQHQGIEGLEHIDKVINIDQTPIGRTPRSNPATYTGAFTPIRELFAQTPEAKARGYEKGRFSFNVRPGRCENCQGDGEIKIEMQFLSDVYVKCEVCQGKRYDRETLEIKYKDKDIAQVLEMTVEEAHDFFEPIPRIKSKLATLMKVGLGYIKLGQPAPTLSGGEAQRVKLAKELSKQSRGHTLYILDEPTTGLHSYDIEKLLQVLHDLVGQGNTVIVIEHNMDIIKTADWIIDLGPEGGDQGGEVITQGPVKKITEEELSYTGRYLEQHLRSVKT